MRFRYDAAAENVARLETACLKTNATVDDCRQQVERSAEDLAGKHINGTELEKIVRKGAEGTAFEYMVSCGDMAHDAYDMDPNKNKEALGVALKNCRDGAVKEGLEKALGQQTGEDKNITRADVVAYVRQGTNKFAAQSLEACASAAPSMEVARTCGSEENMKKLLIKATGNPLTTSEEAIALKDDIMATIFLSAQRMGNLAAEAADDTDVDKDVAKYEAKYEHEADDYFYEATGIKPDGTYDLTMTEKKATAASIVDAALACSDVHSGCADPEQLLNDAIATAKGRMPSVNKNATMDVPTGAASTWTKEDKKYAMQRETQMRDADRKLISRRTDACVVAGSTQADIEQCRDAVSNVRETITPNRDDWKVLDREQRSDKAMEVYDACVEIGEGKDSECETKAVEAAQQLVPEDGEETMETISSMKAKKAKERFAAEQSCGDSEKSVCMQATKEDLQLGNDDTRATTTTTTIKTTTI